MDKKLKNNISNAFGASLSFGFKDDQRDYSLNKEDLAINKYAGINIYQPTPDNIETYIHKYVLNELAFFPRTLNTVIHLNPQKMDNVNSEYVADAVGSVNIKFLSKVIELPFMIIDGELVPFDVIQIEGQRVPYSRENMQKVLYGLERWHEKKQKEESDDPFVGLADRVNPSTSPGFLGTVLRIRDQAVATGGGPTANGSQYIYAGEFVDDLLEKTANLKELTIENMKQLEQEFGKKAYEAVKADFEKIAAEKPEPSENLKLFEKMKNLQFENAIDLPNGTIIAFPEKDGNMISMVNGVVVDNYMSFADKMPNKVKMVVTQDARIKILSNAERFLCFKAPQARFKLEQDNLSTCEEGDLIMAFDGDKALFPCHIQWIARRSFGSGDRRNDVETKIYNMEPIYNDSGISNLLTTSEVQNILNARVNVRLCPLENAKFFEMPYGDFIARKAEELAIDELPLSNMLPKEDVCINYRKTTKPMAIGHKETNMVFATDPETKVIKVKGVIKDYIRDKADLDKLAYVEDEADAFEKTAAIEKNKIKIVCVDKQLPAYNVDIYYVDEGKVAFKRFVKAYKRISKEDLRQLLRIIGYNNIEVGEILFKANSNPQITYALPANPNIQALEGAKPKALAIEKVKNTLKSMVDPKDLTTALAMSLIGNMAADTLRKAPNQTKEIAKKLGKFASDGRALSSIFEKVAMEKKSETAFDIAKIMSLSTFFTEKVASTLNGEAVYPRIYEVGKEIVENHAHLEKVASDLMQLKAMQYKNRNELINPNYIQNAINQLDNLYKVAYGVTDAKYDVDEVLEKEAKLSASAVVDKTKKIVADIAKKPIVKKTTDNVKKAGNNTAKAINNFTGKSIGERMTIGAGLGAGLGAMNAPKSIDFDNGKVKKHRLKGAVNGAVSGAMVGGLFGRNASEEIEALFEKEAYSTSSEIPKDSLAKAVDSVSKKTGLTKEQVIAAVKMIEKSAGAVGGAAIGGLIAGGNAYNKAVDEAKAINPGALPSDYNEDAGKRAVGSAALGVGLGALGGAGLKAIKKAVKKTASEQIDELTKEAEKNKKNSCSTVSWHGIKTIETKKEKKASHEIDDLFKAAEMNVPTEEEKKKENNVATTEELKDIHCEVCGYEGKPDDQGYCPECGTLGGIKPQPRDNASEQLGPSHDMGGEIFSEHAHSFAE